MNTDTPTPRTDALCDECEAAAHTHRECEILLWKHAKAMERLYEAERALADQLAKWLEIAADYAQDSYDESMCKRIAQSLDAWRAARK